MPEKIIKKVRPWRLGLIAVSLLLFMMALTLMKEGAGSLADGLEETFDLSGVAHSLGFGWLAAMLVLSGSPVAAAALTFFDSDAIHELSALAMIMGTRVGAAFIVLAIGLVYVVRGRDRTKSLGIGVLALLVSATTYLPALPAGMAILTSGGLDWARVPGGGLPYKIVSHLFDPVAHVSVDLIAHVGTFVLGLGLTIFSLSLFDRALPNLEEAEEERQLLSKHACKPWIMFAAGAAVTLISLSVTISLSILVPLTQHRIVRFKYLMPYIMGANITTLIDTMFAAVVLDNPEAVTIVLAAFTSIVAVSLVLLTILYVWYERIMLSVTEWAIGDRRHLIASMALLFLVPLLLLAA